MAHFDLIEPEYLALASKDARDFAATFRRREYNVTRSQGIAPIRTGGYTYMETAPCADRCDGGTESLLLDFENNGIELKLQMVPHVNQIQPYRAWMFDTRDQLAIFHYYDGTKISIPEHKLVTDHGLWVENDSDGYGWEVMSPAQIGFLRGRMERGRDLHLMMDREYTYTAYEMRSYTFFIARLEND